MCVYVCVYNGITNLHVSDYVCVSRCEAIPESGSARFWVCECFTCTPQPGSISPGPMDRLGCSDHRGGGPEASSGNVYR